MAPSTTPSLEIFKRQDRNDDGWCCNAFECWRCNSRWNEWGRWVALAVILLSLFALLACCSFVTARRRRRLGQHPYYGTGWMANKWGGATTHNQNHLPTFPPPPPGQGVGQDGYYNPAPPYAPPANGQYYYPPPPPPPSHTHGTQPPQGQQSGVYQETDAIPMHPTGSTLQSNNPYTQPPSSPPPAHTHGTKT